MKASSAAFAATLDGRDQILVYGVTIDLPGGVYPDLTLSVSRVSIKGDTVSDVVASTRLDDGYTAYEAEFTLSGRVDPDDESKTAAWLFARYPFPAADGSLSPIAYQDVFNCAVSITIGTFIDNGDGTVSLESIEPFYGKLDSYKRDRDGNVQFTCIDLRNDLRGTVEFPPVITAAPYNAGLTVEFAMDYLLRAKTGGVVSSWPARRSGCRLAVGMRASLWPEVGKMSANVQPLPQFASAGPGGTALAGFTPVAGGLTEIRYIPSSPFVDKAISVELLMNNMTNGSIRVLLGGDTGYPALIIVTANDVTVRVTRPSGASDSYTWSRDFSNSDVTKPLGIYILWSTTSTDWSVQFRYGSATNSSGTRTAPSARLDNWNRVSITQMSSGNLAGLQVVTGETSNKLRSSFTPRAVIDPSKNQLQVIPPATGDPWSVIQQMAMAELGVAGYFGGRTFRFYNRDSIVSRPIARTLTSDDAFEDAGESSDLASVINRAQVGYIGWTFATVDSIVYSTENPIFVPARGTVPIVVQLEQPVFQIDTTVDVLANGDPSIVSAYRASLDQYGTYSHPGGLTFTVVQNAADKITVTIVNGSEQDAWLVSSSSYPDVPVGTPLFQLSGRTVIPNDEVTVDYQWPTPELGGAASSRLGEIAAPPVTGNAWIQTAQAATSLVKYIVGENYQPRADITDVKVNPDPRVEAADVLHLIDSARTGIDDYIRLWSFELTYEQQQDDQGGTTSTYEMTVSGRALGPPRAWLLGVPGRSELDATTWL